MEQHLLAYLTTKYGVRQLITQWLTSILAAVEHFAPLDAQTALFGKVLRNDVEEEFEEAQLRVTTTANSLLHSILQVSKHPCLKVRLDVTSLQPNVPIPPNPCPPPPPPSQSLPACTTTCCLVSSAMAPYSGFLQHWRNRHTPLLSIAMLGSSL